MSVVPVRLVGIDRRFGAVVALDGADLEIRAGEVHGVLGANGAGKSTLLHVLGGLIQPDAGSIEIDGLSVSLKTPRDAWGHGIALVHQHFMLVPRLSVLENLALGAPGTRGWSAGRVADLRARVEGLMARTGLSIPLDRPVEELGVGDRQRVEILKALLRDPRVLVLDEPTAVLTPGEIDGLFELLREIASEGRAVVLVAHKLDEVLAVADRLTVLRDGRTVLTRDAPDCAVDELVRAMIGEEKVDAMALGLRDGPRTDDGREAGPVVARVRTVDVVDRGAVRLRGVSLDVRGGEIVGIAGVEGNGQRELALVLAGRLAPTAGTVTLPDGVGFIPQDRSSEGLVASFDLTENVALALHRDPAFSVGIRLRWDALRGAAEAIRTRFDVTAPSVASRAAALSGGNQQRVIVGRELHVARDLLVAENPTRGLDVAAAAFVHDEMRGLAERGGAVALVSTDLDEIMGLADRVFVLARGRLEPVPSGGRTREGIGALMLGGVAGG